MRWWYKVAMQFQPPPLLSCVTLSKLLSVTQSSHLYQVIVKTRKVLEMVPGTDEVFFSVGS